MIICAALCWFEEKPEMLSTCVHSLHRVVDYLVALDGPYLSFPHRSARSSDDQAEAIRRSAWLAEIPCEVYGATAPFGTQAAKRDMLCEFVRNSQADWMFVIDGDERVERWSPVFRDVLEETVHDVAMIADGSGGARRLYRCAPDLSVRVGHNGYFGNGAWLGAVSYDTEHPWATPETRTMWSLKIAHDRDLRDRERLKDANRYLIERRKRGET